MSGDHECRPLVLDDLVDLGSGYAMATVILPDGSSWPWLLREARIPRLTAGCVCATCAPHEQLGPWSPSREEAS